MSTRIDSAAGSSRVRRSQRSADRQGQEAQHIQEPGLPVPVDAPRAVPPGSPANGGAAIEAQAEGERRGLRAGPDIHGIAKSAYNRVEYSGSSDRRAPQGRAARTKI